MEPSTAPARHKPPWGAVIGMAWIAFWLVILAPSVIAAARLGTTMGWIGMGALLAGAASYSVACFFGFSPREPCAPRFGLPGVGAMLCGVSTGLAIWALGEEGLSLVPYLAVAVVSALPVRAVLPVLGPALALVSFALWTRGQLAANTGVMWGAGIATLGTTMGRWSMQRDLAAKQFQAEAHELELQDERNRMARDLHDILGHSLTVISLKADLAGKLVDRDPESAKRELGELQSMARAALADVRATVNNYREISLSAELVRARGALADAGIGADLPSTVDAVGPELRELFAWALREAVTNVVRHSGAKSCTVTLDRDRLTVSDDGRGAGAPRDGHGLSGLRDRAARVGASVETGPRPGCAPERPGFALVVREGL